MKVKTKVLNYDAASSDAIDLALSRFQDDTYYQKYDESGDKPEVDYIEVELEESVLREIGKPQKLYLAKHSPNLLIGELGKTSEFEVTHVKYYYQDV